MDDEQLELELSRALARRDPPAGFAARLMARVPEPGPAVAWWWPVWAPAAALAMALLVVVVAGGLWRQREQRLAAERASAEQLMQGLKITSAKLEAVRTRLYRHAAAKQGKL